MSYDNQSHSQRSTLALVVALVAIAVSLVLAGAVYVQRDQVLELEERWRRQHDELVELRTRIERLDGVLDRALDATAIARAVVEESKPR